MSRTLRKQRVAAASIALITIAVAVYYTGTRLSTSPPPPNTRMLMDAETGERFPVVLTADMPGFPHRNPHTGRPALWPTEVCNSQACRAKGGTYVILNSYLGRSGPTYCPGCGAEVIMFNPRPAADEPDEPEQ